MKNNIKVTQELIDNLAELAKLKFDHNANKQIKSDLKKMLGFVNSISTINTDNIEPLIYVSEELNALRMDEIKNELSQEEALKNAPKKDSDYFKVPTVLKK